MVSGLGGGTVANNTNNVGAGRGSATGKRPVPVYVALISATIWHSDEQMSACLLPMSAAL